MVKISKNVSYYCPLFSWVWQYSLHYSCHILKWDTGTKFSGLSIAMSIKSLMDYSGLFLFFWLIMDEHLHSTVAVLELNVNIKLCHVMAIKHLICNKNSLIFNPTALQIFVFDV